MANFWVKFGGRTFSRNSPRGFLFHPGCVKESFMLMLMLKGLWEELSVFFLQDGDVVSEILFYLKQIRSVVGSLCGSVC